MPIWPSSRLERIFLFVSISKLVLINITNIHICFVQLIIENLSYKCNTFALRKNTLILILCMVSNRDNNARTYTLAYAPHQSITEHILWIICTNIPMKNLLNFTTNKPLTEQQINLQVHDWSEWMCVCERSLDQAWHIYWFISLKKSFSRRDAFWWAIEVSSSKITATWTFCFNRLINVIIGSSRLKETPRVTQCEQKNQQKPKTPTYAMHVTSVKELYWTS